MEIHISLQRIFLLAAIQAWFPGSESQDLLASLPESIPALRGSCVEIPCTFPRVPAGFHLIWCRDQAGTDPIIFNNKNPLDIHGAFRGRTFLVGKESNSCSLRIDDVRDSETYYPCINGNFNCNALRGFNKVRVQVSDTPEKPVLTLPPSLTEGTPARITCSVRHTCTHNPPVLLWNKVGFNRTERNEKLEGGVWRFVHEMDYIPTYQDHGSPIVCESIYRSGQVSQETATLDITSPWSGEELPMILGGVAAVILIMLIGLVLYIFVRSRKSQKSATSGKRRAETVVQERINPVYGNIEPQSLYCNVTVNEDIPRNSTERTYVSPMEGEDMYAQPNKQRGVHYSSIRHVPRTQTAKESEHEEIEYASIQH
uniref:Ig-like domain-containing protein n=1 Tax=Xenopus tropicalis TaxID=8364 RepID=A0A803KCE3_XENTR